MSALKRVVMDNIQSHTHTVMEFPETGIIRFMGDNSNGKSVMVKVLQDVVSNAISRPANRRSIVRRGHSYGELLLESYDGRELFVHISLEAAQTWAELRTTGAQPIRRYLSDKAIPLLVREFGWHYDDQCGVSINIHNDTDGLLFVDTKKSVNFELLSGMRSDAFSEAALEELERLVKQTKAKRDEFQHAYDVAEATFVSLQYWDVDKEAAIRDECLYLAAMLENLTMPEVPKFVLGPAPRFYPSMPQVPKMSMPVLYKPMSAQPTTAFQLIRDMSDVVNGKCPTCGKALYEGGHTHEVV